MHVHPHHSTGPRLLRAIVILVTLCLAAAAPRLLLGQSTESARMTTLLQNARHAADADYSDALPAARARAAASSEATASGLLVPVEGVAPRQLHDTYNDARSGGRSHDAIDIHAPRGTPVLAAEDGVIIKLHEGARGGKSIYHLDDDGRTRYYYAHLDHYAEGVREGVRVRRGDVIGYVGDTGNAQPGDYHLHFAVALLSSPARWWSGRNLNPYNLLRPAPTVRARAASR
ncbi:MAG TPA: M23 family metallopeptidase [Longimicrobium sp.]|nr:M23 family metallopeptidase [Longimicrobium sp.]